MAAERAATLPPESPGVTCRRIAPQPPYELRDTAGRDQLLDELTAVLVGLEVPALIWHGHRQPTPVGDLTGASAMRQLTGELLSRESARDTQLVAGTGQPDGVDVDREALDAEARVTSEEPEHAVLPTGRLVRVLGLTEWPAAVSPNWLALAAAECDRIALHVVPLPTAVAGRLLRRRLASMSSSLVLDEQAGRLTDPQVELAAIAAQQLREQLAQGTTRLLRTQVLLALAADTPGELNRAQERLDAVLGAHLASARVLRFEQAAAWGATCLAGRMLAWPTRLLDAATVAATLPHPVGPPSNELDTEGVLVGVEPASGSPLLLDRFALDNPTRLVVGTSGAGKSYASKLELIRQLTQGVRCVVVDPEGEFAPVAHALGGLCLAVGDEPAGLDPIGLAVRPGLAPAEGLSVLVSWAAALLGGRVGSIDLALLDRALDVLRADRVGSSTRPPTTGDLLEVITDLTGHPPFVGADLPARLAPATGGTLAGLFAPNPDLADPPQLVVFDLRAVPDRARPAVMSCVLSWAWSQTLSTSRTGAGRPSGTAASVGGGTRTTQGGRQLVVIDEAHLLLDYPAAAQLLAQFARRARKYGVALEVITQRLSDFLTHPSGQAVLANAATKLLLGCEDHERAAVTQGLGLTYPEAELLRPGHRGRGLLLTAHAHTPVQIIAADAEHLLASAGPR